MNFQVAITAAESVAVSCSGGNVMVTIDAVPNATATACNTVTNLTVSASGVFNNTIDLLGVTGADFTVLAASTIDGGAGDDALTGSSFPDVIGGGDGNDSIIGRQGADSLQGGIGNDTFTWNPGDASDVVDGGAGIDTLTFNGSAASENFTINANGARVQLLRDVAAINMDIGTVETIAVSSLGGTDNVTINDLTTVTDLSSIQLSLGTEVDTTNGSAQANPAIALTIDGGPGDDNLTGSPQSDAILGGDDNDTISGLGGIDTIDGGNGNDTVVGGQGADTVLLSAGDDTFTWSPGDGSDTVDGGTGTDDLVFNGSGAGENFTINANGTGVQLLRDVGAINMNLATIETITLNALAGIDVVTVNNLAGVTDLTGITMFLGGETDSVNAAAQVNGAIALTVNAEGGDDNVTGGAGADIINGGQGIDTLNGSGGNDTFNWNPGDGSDTVNGGAGVDTLMFNGSGANEIFGITRTPSGFVMTRDVGAITMTVDAVETLNLVTLGGDDQVNTMGLTFTTQNLDGGAQAVADVLTADAQGAAVTSGAGTISIAGFAPINHVNFETVNILNAAVLAPSLSATKSVSGTFVPGSAVTYTIVVTNGGTGLQPDNPGNELTDVIPAQLQLVSANATSGTAVPTIATNTVTWNGSIAAGASVTLTIQATVGAAVAAGTIVSNQASLAFDADANGTNEANALSDDPSQGGAADPTPFTVVALPAPSLTATKTVGGAFQAGSAVTYTIVVTNAGPGAQPDNPGNELTDVLPPQLQLVSAIATSGTAVATIVTNTVGWNGSLATGASVTITVQATVGVAVVAGTVVSNQASIAFDADSNGTNESTRMSDDPGAPGATDPTTFVVGASVPTLDETVLLALALILAAVGVRFLR